MKALVLGLIAVTALRPQPADKHDGVYSVWAEPGIHLIMSDNSTPDDYSDDWVIDYEDNREVIVTVLD